MLNCTWEKKNLIYTLYTVLNRNRQIVVKHPAVYYCFHAVYQSAFWRVTYSLRRALTAGPTDDAYSRSVSMEITIIIIIIISLLLSRWFDCAIYNASIRSVRIDNRGDNAAAVSNSNLNTAKRNVGNDSICRRARQLVINIRYDLYRRI